MRPHAAAYGRFRHFQLWMCAFHVRHDRYSKTMLRSFIKGAIVDDPTPVQLRDPRLGGRLLFKPGASKADQLDDLNFRAVLARRRLQLPARAG